MSQDRIFSISVKPHDTETLKIIEELKYKAKYHLGQSFSQLVIQALKEKYNDDR